MHWLIQPAVNTKKVRTCIEAAKNTTEVFSYNIGYYKYIKAVILLSFYKT